jgi:hypothetical protein
MTDKEDLVPFLARFANPLPAVVMEPIRCDPTGQIAQLAGGWVGAPNALRTLRLSRVTKVRNETTDDE